MGKVFICTVNKETKDSYILEHNNDVKVAEIVTELAEKLIGTGWIIYTIVDINLAEGSIVRYFDNSKEYLTFVKELMRVN